jgi:hypothetical protein
MVLAESERLLAKKRNTQRDKDREIAERSRQFALNSGAMTHPSEKSQRSGTNNTLGHIRGNNGAQMRGNNGSAADIGIGTDMKKNSVLDNQKTRTSVMRIEECSDPDLAQPQHHPANSNTSTGTDMPADKFAERTAAPAKTPPYSNDLPRDSKAERVYSHEDGRFDFLVGSANAKLEDARRVMVDASRRAREAEVRVIQIEKELEQVRLCVVCLFTYIHTYMHIYMHTYIHEFVCCLLVHMHTYIHAYIHTCIHTYMCLSVVCVFTYIHAYIHTYIHTCIHTCVRALSACSHTYMHTYIHTYIHTCVCGLSACICRCGYTYLNACMHVCLRV